MPLTSMTNLEMLNLFTKYNNITTQAAFKANHSHIYTFPQCPLLLQCSI